MGWKYDETNKEWITTEEWNNRQAGLVILVIAVVACFALFLLPILPARSLKWLAGYEFIPSEFTVWQYATDLCISSPFYAMIIGAAVYFLMMMGSTSDGTVSSDSLQEMGEKDDGRSKKDTKLEWKEENGKKRKKGK